MLFDNPIFKNWYTDLMDVCRVVPVKDGNVTRQERKKVAEKIPCRVYHTGTGSPSITDNAARIRGEDMFTIGEKQVVMDAITEINDIKMASNLMNEAKNF